jgi:thymidylate synthase (FAD)
MQVELLGHYGSDQIIAQSAWTSTTRDLTEEKMNRIPQLINKLWLEGHHTPFEKGMVHFLVTSDIATHIHCLKHRVGVSINGESARYKELQEDKFYLPEDWKDVKLSESATRYGTFTERLGVNRDWQSVLENYTKIGNEIYHQCLSDLTPILGRKRAKESARYFKTYNSEITYDISFNIRSFFHFQSLRNAQNAQVEVRQLAQQMIELVKDIDGNPFKHSIAAFQNVNN